MIALIVITSISLWGQNRYERTYDNVITLRPLGFLSIYDPGIEVGWIHQPNRNHYISTNYRFSHKIFAGNSADIDQFSHTIDGAIYYPIAFNKNSLFFSIGPKLSYGYRRYFDTYEETDWLTGVTRIYPTTLNSHTFKFQVSVELLKLFKRRFALQFGIDCGLLVRNSSYASRKPPNPVWNYFLGFGLDEEGTFVVPHLRFKFGVGIPIGKRY